MKKQKKQMVILLVLLVAMIAAYFGLGQYSDWSARKEAEREEAEIIYVTNFTAGEVQAISYDYNGVIYSFSKQDDEWIYDADESLDIKESSLNYMVVDIAKLEAGDKVENVTDLSQYGLDEPEITIDFTVAGKEYTLITGDYNDILGKYYAQLTEDSSVVYTISSTLRTTFAKDLEDLVEVEEETEEEETETEAAENDVESEDAVETDTSETTE